MPNILITGGSNGIGEGLVKAYLKKGYYVYNLDRKEPRFEDEHLVHISYDLRDSSGLENLWTSLPHIDILICNAAMFKEESFLEGDYKTLIDVVQVNLLSHIKLSQDYARQFHGNHGRIVFLSSTRSFMSEKNTVGYSVSKGGINALTHSLAITLEDKQITVNAIAPGWIHTSEEELREVDHAFHPSRRVGQVEDIVRTCVFLTDEEADFINGEVLKVDGGVTKKMIYPEDTDA